VNAKKTEPAPIEDLGFIKGQGLTPRIFHGRWLLFASFKAPSMKPTVKQPEQISEKREVIMIPKRCLSCFLVGIGLLISACTSMEAVQKYAEYTRLTIEGVKPVAEDFYASCMRANSAKPLANYNKCEMEQKASQAILMMSNVLDEYGMALGALAADELVNYDKDIDTLRQEIMNLKVKGIEGEKVTAIGSLAKFIAKAATSAYQQKQVAMFITESNDSVVIVANTLADVIRQNYSQAIELEISSWEDTYKRVERVTRNEKPLEWESYSKVQWQTRVELERKLKVAGLLAKSIKKIGITHTKLKKDANNLTSKEIVAVVSSFVNDVKPVIKDLQKAFSK